MHRQLRYPASVHDGRKDELLSLRWRLYAGDARGVLAAVAPYQDPLHPHWMPAQLLAAEGLLQQGSIHASAERARAVVSFAERHEHHEALAEALVALASARRAYPAESVALYERALGLSQRRSTRVAALHGLALSALVVGHPRLAQRRLRQARSLQPAAEPGDARSLDPAVAVASLWIAEAEALTEYHCGNVTEAIASFERLERDAERVRSPIMIAKAVGGQALGRLRLRDLERATALFHRQLHISRQFGWGSMTAQALVNLGEAFRLLGARGHARAAYEAALTHVQGSSHLGQVAKVNVALHQLWQGHIAEAEQTFHAQLGVLRMPGAVILCRLGLMAVAARRGDEATWRHHEPRARRALLGGRHELPEAIELASLAGQWAHAGPLGPHLAARAYAMGYQAALREGDVRSRKALSRQLRRLRAEGAWVPLGDLSLGEVIGTGSGATVYHARTASGEEVAVKVLTASGTARPAALRSLENELHVVAKMDHQHVVWLVDHGVVDEATAVMDPNLAAGARWLATEFAPGGPLTPLCGHLPWSMVQRLLLQVLSGLGPCPQSRGPASRPQAGATS